ncbi:thrombospondin type 3 repeat-containing protein [Desulfosarcina sp.]|uniref:thrombospondin type 3 repeat-containing protein n=1 Tax=Desulfosarcina sp. TaxID=2027861 RepID=UPI003970DA7F
MADKNGNGRLIIASIAACLILSVSTAWADADTDGDGVPDASDNCIMSANPDQRDSDGDGFGNRCDPDLNNDGSVNLIDFGMFGAAYGTSDPDADLNGSGKVDLADFSIFGSFYGASPGPSGGGVGSDPHASLTYGAYPGNCLACHAEQADEMLQTTHYQWLGEAPDMVNGVGQRQGKLTNAVNSYCINIEGDWPVCGSCHVGRGQRPDEAGDDRENVDCLVCHNDDYAAQRARLPDGSMGVAQPDDGMVRNVHRPTRANCLACHATAGGGDGVKRGDLSRATVTNADRNFDVHMNGSGANLECQSCHVFDKHKVIGKGSDLRPTDDLARGSEVSCLTCHADKNSPKGHDTAKINDHVARVACQTCHIPVYAKVATETYRDWRIHHDGSPADATAVAGHPYTEKAANLTPTYRFWNRKSDNALLGDDASRAYNGDTDTWPTSTPLGSVTSGKLYPFKYKTAMQPVTRADHRLIALNTFEYLKGTGDVDTAIQLGLTAMGYPANEPYDWVLTDTHGMLNHGISPASDALSCTDCHGRIDRMDLQGDLGYQLKAEKSTVCSQCHGQKENKSFAVIHDKHVKDKKYDCSSCHTFSRPER